MHTPHMMLHTLASKTIAFHDGYGRFVVKLVIPKLNLHL